LYLHPGQQAERAQLAWVDCTHFKEENLSKLEPLAQAVLDVRAAYPGASLADLYDPDTSRRISARPIGRWIGLWIGFIGA
ncbi:MAG: hypothetical protein OXC47_05905, partial [Cyanobacteria bacterium MAG APA_bin_95]|nr:hypothetical protein [Cyanobacteria bacterium MAG APA_bin_95]